MDWKDIRLCLAYPNKGNYSETFIYNQIKYLQPVKYIYQGFYPALDDQGEIFSFPFNSILVRGTLRNLTPDLYHRIYTKIFSDFLKKNNINVVLAEYGPMGTSLADACKAANVPILVHFHGYDAYSYATLDKYGKKYSDMFQRVDGIIVVSNDMKEQLISLGAPSEKLFYNPYGVDLEKFSGANPGSADCIFIYVGRFTGKKAPFNTIRAFEKVVKKNSKARMVMIGGGELLEESRQLVTELGLNDSIDIKGVQSPEVIAAELKKARVFVQHSLRTSSGDSEGTPNTILEASASGLPIVSTQHAGIKDAVKHGDTGFLVPEGDVDGMADYMIQLAGDPQLAGVMGSNSRKYIAENFNMNLRIEKLKEIIKVVCTAKGSK